MINFHSWSEERVEQLKALWAAGKSASKVAEALGGGVTRSAVIAKIHRLGLPERPQDKPGRRPTAATRPEKRIVVRRPPPPPKPKEMHVKHSAAPSLAPEDVISKLGCFDPAPEGKGVRHELHVSGQCRWPLGDASDNETFRFCGEPCDVMETYCKGHTALAGGGQPRSNYVERKKGRLTA